MVVTRIDYRLVDGGRFGFLLGGAEYAVDSRAEPRGDAVSRWTGIRWLLGLLYLEGCAAGDCAG